MLKKISEEDIQRYAHQIILKNIGIDGQKKLLISKVFILGMGGLGSPVSMYLASAGIGNLGIADFDNVELSNLQRQVLFDQKSINKSKVEIAKKNLVKRFIYASTSSVYGIKKEIDVDETMSLEP